MGKIIKRKSAGETRPKKAKATRSTKQLKTRRRVFAIAGIAAVIGVFVLVVVLASGTRTLHQVALDNLAEARFFMMQADSDNERVQFFSGLREQDYRMDGRATRAIPFALINLEPKNATHIDEQQLQGTIQVDENAPVTVTLERNQFGRNFAVDIGRNVPADATVTFTLKLDNDYTVVFDLKNVMTEDAIGWEDALKIAVDHLQEHIKDARSFETYVKIITDQSNIAAFWFVQFVTDAGDLFFVVIGADGSVIGNQR